MLAFDGTRIKAEMELEMQAETRVRARTRAEAQAEADAEAETRAAALAVTLKEGQAVRIVEAQAVARALARAVALSEALTEAVTRTTDTRTRTLVRALAGGAFTFRYDDMLEDSKLKDIIYSIGPYHRQKLARDLWRRSNSLQQYWWLIQIIVPITRLPTELLQQILLIVVDETNDSTLALMRVCKYWHTTVTGIWASLRLGTRTPKLAVTSKLRRNQWLLDISVDTEFDRGNSTPSEGDYEAIFAAMEATARWQSFIIETFPPPAHLPEHFVNRGLQRCCSNTTMSRLRTFKVKSACEMSPLLNRLLRILGTTASEELTTVEIKSANVISFLTPTYSKIFHSIRVLCLDTPGLSDPVALLPHLHQLEDFSASHLSLLTYDDDVNLPLVHTLRHLSLRAVSIQWMSGRTFHGLLSCTLLFPLHRPVLHTFRATFPNCKELTFRGYPLDILDGVSAPELTYLSVRSSCFNKLRGNQQLVRFSSRALRETRLAPQILHISIEATTQAWTRALDFMSNLVELVIESPRPSSLGVKVLQALVVHPVHANNLDTTGEQYTPVCPSLKRFGLGYRRWLRPSEHFDMIPELISMVWSRQQSTFALQSVRIWTGCDQKHPLELIEGSWINFKGFERLVKDSAIKGGSLVGLVVSRLVENMFKPSGKSSAVRPNCN
jgi:hypothetical protein